MSRSGVVVCGGEFHDFDYVGRELSAELEARCGVSVMMREDYPESAAELPEGSYLVTYTCNRPPTPEGLRILLDFLLRGGRWLALHATNAVLAPPTQPGGRWGTPTLAPQFALLLGSRFLAHPPLHEFTVSPAVDTALLDGIAAFEVTDELYVCEWLAPVDILLTSAFGGECPTFEDGHEVAYAQHPIMYTRRIGAGEICYLTLGHANAEAPGRAAHYAAWRLPEFRWLLGNCLDWVTATGVEVEPV